MALIVEQWSTNASANSDPPPNGAPEGMFADKVNDTMRQMMASQREIYDGTLGLVANMPGGADLENPTPLPSEAWDPLPIGAVIMWAGNAAAIPSGWAICDGTNGTIDLSAAFPKAAAGDGDVGVRGGATDTGAGGAHSHGGSSGSTTLTQDQMPNHAHSQGSLTVQAAGDHEHLAVRNTASGTQLSGSGGSNPRIAIEGNIGGETYTLAGGTGVPERGRTSLAGSHSHSLSGSTQTIGGGQSHNHTIPAEADHVHPNDPVHCQLYFIQKISASV